MKHSSKSVILHILAIIFFFVIFTPFNCHAQDANVKAIQDRLKQQLLKKILPQKVAVCPFCGDTLIIDVPKREFQCPNEKCKRVFPKDHDCKQRECALVKQIKIDSNFVKLSITNRCVTFNTFRYNIVNKRGISLASGELDSPGVFEKVVPYGFKIYIYSIPNQRLQPNVGNNIILE